MAIFLYCYWQRTCKLYCMEPVLTDSSALVNCVSVGSTFGTWFSLYNCALIAIYFLSSRAVSVKQVVIRTLWKSSLFMLTVQCSVCSYVLLQLSFKVGSTTMEKAKLVGLKNASRYDISWNSIISSQQLSRCEAELFNRTNCNLYVLMMSLTLLCWLFSLLDVTNRGIMGLETTMLLRNQQKSTP